MTYQQMTRINEQAYAARLRAERDRLDAQARVTKDWASRDAELSVYTQRWEMADRAHTAACNVATIADLRLFGRCW